MGTAMSAEALSITRLEGSRGRGGRLWSYRPGSTAVGGHQVWRTEVCAAAVRARRGVAVTAEGQRFTGASLPDLGELDRVSPTRIRNVFGKIGRGERPSTSDASVPNRGPSSEKRSARAAISERSLTLGLSRCIR
jgi:hypothetical protein